MAKKEKVLKPEEEALGVAASKTEQFFIDHEKGVIYALIGLFVLAALIFGYKKLIADPRVERAADMISEAQYRFEAQTPDYEAALNGDESGAGFLEVIDKYGSTPAGNLAKHYAGICYLKLGDRDNAEKYLSKYSHKRGIPASIVNAQNYGLRGDIAVDNGDYAAALALFEKAVKASDNNVTAPLYLRKAALAAEAAGDNAKALSLLKRITAEYPASYEARDAEKYIGSMK